MKQKIKKERKKEKLKKKKKKKKSCLKDNIPNAVKIQFSHLCFSGVGVLVIRHDFGNNIW